MSLVTHLLSTIIVSCLHSPFTCLLSHVSCHPSPVNYPCELSPITCLLSHVSCHPSLVNHPCILSHLSYHLSPVSCLLSPISWQPSLCPVSCHLSPISCRLCLISSLCLPSPFTYSYGYWFCVVLIAGHFHSTILWTKYLFHNTFHLLSCLGKYLSEN